MEDKGFAVLDTLTQNRQAHVQKCAVAAYNYHSVNQTNIAMRLFGLYGKECWVGVGDDVYSYRDGGPAWCKNEMNVYIFTDMGRCSAEL